MPAPTTYKAPKAPAFDLLTEVRILREGEYPKIYCTFRAVDDLSPRVNALGRPLYESRGEPYTLLLDSARTGALGKISTLMGETRTRIVAGEDLDSAIANEAYDLLAECVALGSTKAILKIGVEVLGANPFQP